MISPLGPAFNCCWTSGCRPTIRHSSLKFRQNSFRIGSKLSDQDDNTAKWACIADEVTVDALDKRYLPETCKDEEEDEEEEEERGDG